MASSMQVGVAAAYQEGHQQPATQCCKMHTGELQKQFQVPQAVQLCTTIHTLHDLDRTLEGDAESCKACGQFKREQTQHMRSLPLQHTCCNNRCVYVAQNSSVSETRSSTELRQTCHRCCSKVFTASGVLLPLAQLVHSLVRGLSVEQHAMQASDTAPDGTCCCTCAHDAQSILFASKN